MIDRVPARRGASHRAPGSVRIPSPASIIRTVAAIGLVALVALWSPSYSVTVLAALLLPVVAWRYALTTVVFLAIVAREAPAGRGFAPESTLGSQIFYQGKIPVINFLALSAIVVAFIRLRNQRQRLVLSRTAWWLLGCLGALALLAFILGIANDQSIFSAVNQNSRNFVTVALGVAMGLLIMAFPEEIKSVAIASVCGLGLLVVVAGYAVATGQAADERVSRYFTYYDSALPAVATAIFGALLIGRSRLTWPARVAMGFSLALIVIGFRLTIWATAVAVLVLAVLLSRLWVITGRRIAISVVVLLAVVLVLPGMRTDITSRVVGASSAATTVAGPITPTPSQSASPSPPTAPAKKVAPAGGFGVAADSTQGHLQDIRIAWSYVRNNFWTGIGPEHPQLPGLASDNTHVLYVHDEWLQDWLRFGPGAVVLITLFLLIVAWLAARTLVDRGSTTLRRAAAILGLMTPLCLLDFPYLSKSNQWPLLLGIAAGILAATVTSGDSTQSSSEPARHSVDAEEMVSP
jgi:hypothetical protein